MKNKKAFEIQFNWIFVLVAGAAILIIFTFIIYKQKNLSESSANGIALRSIESVVAGTSASTDVSSLIQVPDLSIEVDCGRISIGKTSKQYPRMVLFAPSLVKGSKIIAQTLSFSAPYKSSNLLFMTSQQIRYILIGNSDLSKAINKSLPSQINKENFSFYNPPDIKNFNNYKVRFVFDNLDVPSNVPGSLSKMPVGDVTALKITGDIGKGEIEFYENDKNGNFVSKGRSAYIGKAALIGAIYADTAEHYECNMKNVFAKHGLISDVYAGRTAALRQASISSECNAVYDDSMGYLNTIGSISKTLATTSLSLELQSMSGISSAANMLSIQNKEAQKLSCPMVY